MKLSEVIKRLNEELEIYGDLDVTCWDCYNDYRQDFTETNIEVKRNGDYKVIHLGWG